LKGISAQEIREFLDSTKGVYSHEIKFFSGITDEFADFMYKNMGTQKNLTPQLIGLPSIK